MCEACYNYNLILCNLYLENSYLNSVGIRAMYGLILPILLNE